MNKKPSRIGHYAAVATILIGGAGVAIALLALKIYIFLSIIRFFGVNI